MNNNEIKKVFEKVDIKVTNIERPKNSYNSAVYIINNNKIKYVLKINNNFKKTKTESNYINHLSKYLPTPSIITTGIYNDKSYIIMTYFDGINKFDCDANKLIDNELKNIGILLAKLHSVPLIENNNSSWAEYLKECLEKTQNILKKELKEHNDIIYNYLKDYINNNIINNYTESILHMDFRIGNLMFRNDDIGLIDMESMKNGEYVFDFVKIYKLLNKDKFDIVLNSYKKLKNIEDNFIERLEFYTLFDSYTSLWWCIAKNKTDSDFYRNNLNIVLKYVYK